jgi:hypothetical protein
MMRLFYFAYGSNLCLPRLRARVPSCQVVTTAALPEHALRFHKRGRDGSAKCDAYRTGSPLDRVLGVVYSLLETERPALDAAEDLGRGYDASWVEVQSDQGALQVMTYCARAEMIEARLQPFDWYHAFVVRGARQRGFPDDYIRQIEAVCYQPDPDRTRQAANRALLQLPMNQPE